ncbi:MAG: GWxTD domain-containing protein, partial [Balneolaceae bacterium]|nr:GWxTD domain-containing protein [Balneolaceae bacterium]
MWRSIISSAFILILLLGCARTYNPDIERGSNYNFQKGHPEVRLSAIGFLDEDDKPHISVAADIVYGSLIYKKQGNKQRANVAIEIRIVDRENPENIIRTHRTTLTMEEEDADIIYSQDVFVFEKSIPVEPGEYQINLTAIDQNSAKQTTRVSTTFIPDPQNEISNLTNIRMLGKRTDGSNSAWLPVTTYDVPKKVDSLKFIFQVTNNKSEEPLTIDTRLIRYDSDSSVARPMHFNNYSPSSIRYKGIEYDRSEIIQSSRRVLSQSGSVLIEFKFPQQKRGNYRFEVNTNERSGNSLFKARDFGIKSPNYPSLQSPIELARPLVYLMDDDEYEELMAIEDSDSLKQAVDRFWLKNIRDKSRAKSVIELYY